MATRGWEGITSGANSSGTSKYHNRRVTLDGLRFDSVREAGYWQVLQSRAAAGEITELRRQVAFPLLCPFEDRSVMVCTYIADFTYRDRDGFHVVDVKGMKTPMYRLKKRWLQLQDGIVVEEA